MESLLKKFYVWRRVGDGMGVGFFVERFRCLRGGVVGVAKHLLNLWPNDSSAAFVAVSYAETKTVPRVKKKSSPDKLRDTAAPEAAKVADRRTRTPKRGVLVSRVRTRVLECGYGR